MKHAFPILILLWMTSLFPSTATAADCFIDCMQRSGCWSGRSISDPSGCNVQPELCRIQCQGKSNNTWGAIAYSKKDKMSGWSFDQADKATAERLAMQYCTRSGGAACVVETSFNNSCGAVAADGDLVAWGALSTKISAQQRALAECMKIGGKKCEVEASVCSSPNSGSGQPSAPSAPKAISWGAIAYSSGDMGAGYSQGKSDRASAEREALSICSQRGKACVVQAAFNKQCASLAADGSVTGSAVATDQRESQQKAIDECRKAGGGRCVLHISFCSM
jgi:hypothetical protein